MCDAPGSRSKNGGFTLIEVVIVVVMIGIVAAVLAATATLILRTTGPTSDRVDDSRTLHGLNTWLARDASATPPDSFSIPGSLTDCAGSAPGTSLVTMTWAEDTGSATTFVSNYRHAQEGGDYRLYRYTCSGTGVGPYSNTERLRLTSVLSPTPPTVTPVFDASPTPRVIGVEFDVITAIGEAVLVDAGSRNPAVTLPATTTTTTTTTTPTTTTTTTTVPSAACDLTGSPTTEINIAPNPVTKTGGGNRPLSAAVTVSIQTINTSSCGALTLRYDRGPGPVQNDSFVSTGPDTWQVVLPANGPNWSGGAHPLDVFDGAVQLNEGAYSLQVN